MSKNRDWTFEVHVSGITRERAYELFEALADLAHDRGEDADCTMGPREPA